MQRKEKGRLEDFPGGLIHFNGGITRDKLPELIYLKMVREIENQVVEMDKTIYKIGFWVALVAFVAAFGFSVVQILQIIGVLGYPWDAILIYGFSLFIATPFMLALLALHYVTPDEKRFWSHAAVLFALMYAIYVTLNYAVQLTAVIPYAAPDPVLIQTPHSLFWTVDALGYIALGLATLFAVPLFGKQGLQKWVRWFFLANFLITPLISFVYFYPEFSTTLLLLGVPWIITAVGSMLLLTLYFKEQMGNMKQDSAE